MNKLMNFSILCFLAVIIFSCTPTTKNAENTQKTEDTVVVVENAIKSVLTAEEQKNMTPDEIIGRLKKGNENFVNNNLTTRDHSAQRREAMIGQYPQAIVLSCVDSRVPVEDVFDLGIGDIFVARVAGNIENEDIVGSMEFATAVAGSKLVIVLGHSACGAVKHAIDKTDAASMQMNSLQVLLNEIQPSVEATPKNGEVSSKNDDFVNSVIAKNTQITVDDIRKRSPKLTSLEKEGKIKIVPAVYNMSTGKVEFL